MARQEGIIKLKGKIGDLTFYKTKNGYLVREKTGVDGNRINNDENFKRTRENMAEFGRATKAGKFLRTAFKVLTKQLADARVSNRLMAAMLEVVKADTVNDRGQRMVLDAETELLKGFDFNINAPVASTLFFDYSTSIDRASGLMRVSIPDFSARDMVTAPNGASHFQLNAAAASIDFEAEQFELAVAASDMIAVNETNVSNFKLDCQLTANSTSPLFLLLGICFFQRVNGQYYPLSNGAFNGLSMVDVKGV